MERLPAEGIWWIPGQQHARSQGRIEGDRGDIKLSLLGNPLEERADNFTIKSESLSTDQAIPLVSGVIRGKSVSLLNVREIGYSFSAPGFQVYSYKPEFVVFGRQFETVESASPIEMGIEFTHLLQWFGTKGLRQTTEWGEADGLRSVTWNYSHPPSIEWNVREYSVSLSTGLHTKGPWNGIDAYEYGYMKIRSEQPRTLAAWLSEIVQPIESLLNIAILATVNTEKVRLTFDDEIGAKDANSLNYLSSELVVNRRQSNVRTVGRLSNEDFLFKAVDVNDDILTNFLDIQSNQRSTYEQFLLFEREPMIPDERFLAYVRLLESLHRQFFPVNPMDITKHQDRTERILTVVHQDDLSLVDRLMRFGYEPSLNNRLHQLTKPWKSLLMGAYGERKHIADEITRVTKHRNYLAHKLDEDQRQFFGDEIERANLFLTVLFRLNVLLATGFTTEQSCNIMRQSNLYLVLCERCAPKMT